jgi:hypothetical protein
MDMIFFQLYSQFGLPFPSYYNFKLFDQEIIYYNHGNHNSSHSSSIPLDGILTLVVRYQLLRMFLVVNLTLDFHSTYHSFCILLEHLQLWPQALQAIIDQDSMQPCSGN